MFKTLQPWLSFKRIDEYCQIICEHKSGESLSLSRSELVRLCQQQGVRLMLVAVRVSSLWVCVEDCGSAHIPFLLRAVFSDQKRQDVRTSC